MKYFHEWILVCRKTSLLMTYDTRSVSERKNPMAAVRAFNKAFGNSKEATLLLKLNTPLDWEAIRN